MLFGEYRFRAIFSSNALLPPYKGSTFRGAFGWALKAVVCALKHQECPTCLLRQQCVYVEVLDVPVVRPDPGQPSRPHPFVIEPPLTLTTHFVHGDEFNFSLLLFGRVTLYLPYFVYAFEKMGEMGVGRRLEGRRGVFRLESVASSHGLLYQASDRCLLSDEAPDLVLEAPGKSVRKLTVTLVTPLRLKRQERLQDELPFHVLVRAILRRLAVLNTYYGNGEPHLDYRGLVARAREVEVAHTAVHWLDWERYSFRQERAMLLGGMVGEVTYQGNLGEFVPLLNFAEKVHLGKATTFGLGKIMIMETEDMFKFPEK